jgi:DNA-binding transcriptional ArsR family regulator
MGLLAVSKHVKVLEQARLIERRHSAQWRFVRLTAEPFKEVAAWVEDYRCYWDESLDQLDAYLRDLPPEGNLQDD